MGVPAVTGFTLAEEPLPPELPASVPDLVALAVEQRPDLRDLRLEESAAERFSRAEHDLFFPTVEVTGTMGLVPANTDAIPPRYGAIGLTINIPIFNGGLFRARQTEAELKAKAAASNVGDLRNRVTRDVRVAWLAATTARDRMALTQQLQDQAQLAMDLAQSRYDLGLSSIVELSQAQLNLTSAQIGNTSARYDYQAQRVMVDYQTGSLR
jgi:outer membrane protein